jgi:glucose/arabinose dehydrogenase
VSGRLAAALVAAFLVLGASAAAAGPPPPGGLGLVPVGRFATPVGVVGAPDAAGRVYVVEKAGRIVARDRRGQRTFLDISARVQDDGYEQGLLGLAFPPDYAVSGKFYVYYTAPAAGAVNGGTDLVVSEFRRGATGQADPARERVLLRIPHRLEEYENGGQLAFGPDGMLWIGTGDGGGDGDPHGNAQRLDPATDDPAAGADALLGKLLRVDPTPGDGCGGGCTIPAGNPGFPAREVWAYGLRNPWRFSFDRVTGALALADVGNHLFEELDVAAAPGLGRGANYGWPFFEGASGGSGAPAGCCTPPALARSHGAPDDVDALIGGVVVRDAGLPLVQGRYLFAPLGRGEIHSVRLDGDRASDDRDTRLRAPNLTSFGEDSCGRVYVTTFDGVLYRLSQGSGACGAVGLTLTVPERQRLAGRAVRTTMTCATSCTVEIFLSLRIGGRTVAHTATVSRSLTGGVRTAVNVRVPAATAGVLDRAARRGRTVTVRVVVAARAGASGAARRASALARLVR